MKFSPSIYYFTQKDPDYNIKGSRDPLGTQVLWQNQAKKLIPYLSTVSFNLHDFQILSLAHHLYGKEPDILIAKFLIRFEQVMAYVRHQFLKDGGFNGINRVRKKLQDSTNVSISNKSSDEILSNQRAYGIWGKYNRPFTDIRIVEYPDFDTILSQKLETLPRAAFDKFLTRLHQPGGFKTDVYELEFLSQLLEVTPAEKKMYVEKILKINAGNPYQNQLFEFLLSYSITAPLNFYNILQDFKASPYATDLSLQHILTDIEETERLLSPVNHIFRYLQTKPLWTKSEIESDTFINRCKISRNYNFIADSEENKTKNQLVISLQKNNWNLIEDLVKRNKDVSAWRGGVAWVSISNDILEIHHGEGSNFYVEYDPIIRNDNFYFFDTYTRLHKQIV
jgi:hypothetical protein